MPFANSLHCRIGGNAHHQMQLLQNQIGKANSTTSACTRQGGRVMCVDLKSYLSETPAVHHSTVEIEPLPRFRILKRVIRANLFCGNET